MMEPETEHDTVATYRNRLFRLHNEVRENQRITVILEDAFVRLYQELLRISRNSPARAPEEKWDKVLDIDATVPLSQEQATYFTAEIEQLRAACFPEKSLELQHGSK